MKKITTILKFLPLFLVLSCSGYELKNTVKVSHRGYAENTVSGFSQAINDGYDYVETDVRLRNGEAVLLHDDVPCNDCDELSTLLGLAQHRLVTVFIEIKELEVIEKAVDVVNSYFANVVFISFDPQTLITLNAITNHPLGLITNSGENITTVSGIIDWVVIHKNYVQNCDVNLKCVVWTIINQSEFDSFNGNVDAIIMDRF